MKNSIIVLLTILIVSSCQESKEIKIDFERVLSNEIIQLENLGSPIRIKIDSDKRMIYLLQRSGSDLLKVYDLDTFEFINSFIKKGEGPNEQIIGWTLQLDFKNKLIYSTDPIKKRLFAYSMDSVELGKASFWPSFDIDLRNIGPEKPLVIDDDLLIDFRKNYQSKDSYSYNLIDFSGELVSTVGKYPDTQTEIDNFQQSEAFSGEFNVSKNGKFIIRSFLFSDRLEKLDFEGNILNIYIGPTQFEPQFSTKDLGGGSSRVVPVAGSLIGFSNQPAIGNDELYILYDGKEFYRDDEESNLLFNFDSDLNLKQIIYLDQRILDFDIDWTNNTLFGFSSDVEGGLVKYKLK